MTNSEEGNRLEWNAPPASEVAFYRVYISTGSEYSLLAETLGMTYLDPAGDNNTWYALTAVGPDGGESVPSNADSPGSTLLPYPHCLEVVVQVPYPPFFEPNEACLCPVPPPAFESWGGTDIRDSGPVGVVMTVPVTMDHESIICD